MNIALHASRRPGPVGEMARRLAGLALGVMLLAVVLFAAAWMIGGEEAVSDNWVGVTVVIGFFAGLVGSFVALVTATVAGLRHEPWSQLWLPLATLPAVVVVAVLLEALVFE